MLSLPHALRFLLATDPQALTRVLGVVNRNSSRYLIGKAGNVCGRKAPSEHKVRYTSRLGQGRGLNVLSAEGN